MTGKKNGLVVMMNLMIVASLLWTTLLLTLVAPTEAVTLTFNVATATGVEYSELLTNIRNELRDTGLNYGGTGLPVIAAPTIPPEYLYVDLVYGIKTITIGLNRNDLYVVGYRDFVDGHYRVQYFLDAPTNAGTDLFPQVPARYTTKLHYKSSYDKIAEGTSIGKDVGLGIEALREHLNNVYGVKVDRGNKKQGKFLVTVIHMVSEAARSRYIQTKIVENFDNGLYESYKIDPRAESLELKWGKISAGIKWSNNSVFLRPIAGLKDIDGHPRTVARVSDIVYDMALLMYEPLPIPSLYSSVIADTNVI